MLSVATAKYLAVNELNKMRPTAEEALIVLLMHGDVNPGYIANEVDRHPASISRTLPELVEKSLVVPKSSKGPYTLTPEGYQKARSVMMRRIEEK